MATLQEQLGYPNVSLGYMDNIAYPGNFEVVGGTPGPPVVGDQILVWTLVTDLSDYSTLGTDPITTPTLSSCTLLDSNELNTRLKWYVFEVTSNPPDPWLEMTMPGIGGGALPGCVYWLVYTDVSNETLTVNDFKLQSGEVATTSPWSLPQPAGSLTAGQYYNGFALAYDPSPVFGPYEFTSFPINWGSTAPTGRTNALPATDPWYDWQNQGSMAMQAYVPYAAGSEETDPWIFTGSLGLANPIAYWTVEFSYSFVSAVSQDVLSTVATIDHDLVIGIGPDQHHAEAHALAGSNHTGGFYVETGSNPSISDSDLLPSIGVENGMIAMTHNTTTGTKMMWIRTNGTWTAFEVTE